MCGINAVRIWNVMFFLEILFHEGSRFLDGDVLCYGHNNKRGTTNAPCICLLCPYMDAIQWVLFHDIFAFVHYVYAFLGLLHDTASLQVEHLAF